LLESLVAGRNTDADALLAITRAISELLPPPVPKIPEVKIEIVDTLVGICSKCGHEHRPYQPPVEGGKQNCGSVSVTTRGATAPSYTSNKRH
jgi:hypothetical protein